MRIIGGVFKGRRIPVPAKFKGRPTTDFAREALFNVLNNRLEWDGLRVLDLFSGTGAMAYEALSRGAQSVTAVEKDPAGCGFIKTMFNTLGTSTGVVIRADVFRFIERHTAQYGLIIADPPYDLERVELLPEMVKNQRMLAPRGVFVLEHSERKSVEHMDGFVECRKYGAVSFSFFTFDE
jgi:16S rRNA (guanine(966)-N(2))-methyltransferase RsmD